MGEEGKGEGGGGGGRGRWRVDVEVECRAGEEERRKVRAACIDMWPAFEAAVARNYLMQRWSSIRSMSWPTRARRWTR